VELARQRLALAFGTPGGRFDEMRDALATTGHAQQFA
jgi:hypothetical protein